MIKLGVCLAYSFSDRSYTYPPASKGSPIWNLENLKIMRTQA